MMTLYHGTPFLFDKFDLTGAGEGTGIKYGFGVYLTEVEASAVHYSQPRNMELMPEHYLYTVEIPELTEDNHLTSALPVSPIIINKVEEKLGATAPEKVKAKGKEFRKWVGKTITGAKKAGFEEEKAAAEFLYSLGVLYNVWPTAQTKPNGPKNIAVFDAANVRIVKRERIDIENKCKKWVLTSRKEILSSSTANLEVDIVDYNINNIPEEKIFTQYVSFQDETYTFKTNGYYSVNGERVNEINITLTPKEVISIRQWFWNRKKKWIGYVPLEFRSHDPELYDKLYKAEVDFINHSDPLEDWEIDLVEGDYDPDCVLEYDSSFDIMDNNCPIQPLLWPKQLFEDMNITCPNISIWVKEKDEKLWGLGYPLYIEDSFVPVLKEIVENRILIPKTTSYVDIELLKDTYPELHSALKEGIEEWFPEYGVDISDTNLTYSLYQLTILDSTKDI